MEAFEDDDPDVSEGQEVSHSGLGGLMALSWCTRKVKLEHDYAITGWALSVMPEVYKDARERLTGEHRDAIERVVRKLFKYPYTNHILEVQGMTEDEIVDTFWDEFKAFCNKMAPFDKQSRWNSQSAMLGKSYIWHEKYSKPHTKVLGRTACQAVSPNPGIGPCERNWGGVKGIKCGNRGLMSAESTAKRAIVYTTALVTDARMKRLADEKIDATGASAMFCDDDMK